MKGTWDKDEKVCFNGNATTASRVDEHGDSVVEMTSIDSVLAGKPVTFIKLDVEGSEFKTFQGAKKTIQKWKPRLAVSHYHRYEDFVVLPLLVLDLLPEYHLAMRTYTPTGQEMVLFAWVD